MEQKTEASQAVDSIPTWRERMAKAGLPYPGYKPDSYMEAEIADLRAALKAQPAPTVALGAAQHAIHNLREYRAGRMTFPSEAIAILEAAMHPATTEAAQVSFLVRVTPMNQEYADVHPELALEDALRVNPHGWPDGFQFEVVAAQGAQLSGISGELANKQLFENIEQLAQGEDSARLEFMMQREAWIGWSKDGESCRVFHMDQDGDSLPMLGWGNRNWSNDPREAIDRARASAETGGVKP